MQAIGLDYGGTDHTNPTHIKKALKIMLEKAGVKDEEMLAKQLMGISETSIASGNVGLAGMGEFVAKDAAGNVVNKFRITDNATQAAIAKAKFQNLEPQTRQRTLHQNSVITEGVSGNVHDIDEVQAAILSAFNDADTNQIGRSRDDLRRQLKRANMEAKLNPAKFKNFLAAKKSNLSLSKTDGYLDKNDKLINI